MLSGLRWSRESENTEVKRGGGIRGFLREEKD